MKVAIVHDYLFQFGGGEKVVEKWLSMYPEADIYTSFFVTEKFRASPLITAAIKDKRVKATWLQKLFGSPVMRNQNQAELKIEKSPLLSKYFKHFFWLYPLVMNFVTVNNYDLVIISSTYCAKNVKYKNCNRVVHYCNSPTRFLHGLVTETDHNTINPVLRLLMPLIKVVLKPLDLSAVKYLNKIGTIWISNSKHIQEVVKKVYNTQSQVLYPPVEIEHFLNLPKKINLQQPYYYYFGRISFHKRIDLAIMSCLELQRKLVITGTAAFQAEMDKLKQLVSQFEAQHPEAKGLVTFTGRSSDTERDLLLSGAKAFLFPGKEDFGIAPIEALASGTPIIAYQAGGALEYVQDQINGIFFAEQTLDQMKAAILKFEEKSEWDEAKIRSTTHNFDEKVFADQFKNIAEI